MIGTLTGKITSIDAHGIILSVGGVGFRVHVMGEYLAQISEGKEVTLYTHLAVREDSLELFGFAKQEELDLFHLLLTVPGIGPKSALSILTIAPPETLIRAISTRDTSYLTRVSGIGRKTAEKIVLELKDKVGVIGEERELHELKEDADAMLALKSLGYRTDEARDALKKIPREVVQAGDRIREALKILSKENTRNS